MQDFEKLGAFYLGRVYDPVQRRTTGELLMYDSKDLVTHAVIVGMTGSGKTGLGIALLEEAAIDGIPAIIIDPKGDLGNLLLQFPGLQGADFEPWVNAEDAQRGGKSVADYAAGQAELWRDGMAGWGEDGARIARLQSAADFAIYTPASSAGLPLSILKSFAPPAAAIMDDREALRDRISTTASAVLALLGIDAEPMKSREHILVSGILDAAWKQGEALDLAALIARIQNPPMQRLGVVDVETFYPAKDRFELALALNNLLASPGFEAWLEGEPLDIDRLLRAPGGKPRHSVISIAHLSDTERMFFVSMLLGEVLAWTRAQSGTTSLRAVVYMDEIFGYFPPTANPPSKRPLLTLLKQARAFGVGVVLATQNPVDLDYKGLSNAGTWFIGRLQTERDKDRLMAGLESASSESGGPIDRAQIDSVLSNLGKRVFLMNNVHESAPVAFETRWTLSYLRGPLTRAQMKQLTAGRGSHAPEIPAALPKPGAAVAPAGSPVVLPPGVPYGYLPVRGSAAGIVYHPILLGAAEIRFTDAKSRLDTAEERVFLTAIKDEAVPVEWDEARPVEIDPDSVETAPSDGCSFAPLPPPAANPKNYAKWSKDFVTWVYGSQQLQMYRSPSTGLASTPGENEQAFRARIDQQCREQRDAALAKLRQRYAPKLQTLNDRLLRAQQATARERDQTFGTAVSVGATLLGAFFGGRRSVGTAVRQASRAYKDTQDVSRAQESVAAVQQAIDTLQTQLKAETEALQAKLDAATEMLETVAVKPKKANISVRLLTLAWAPYRGEDPAW